MILIKLYKAGETNWGIELSPEVKIEGFPVVADAAVFVMHYMRMMVELGQANELRRNMLGAAILGETTKDKKQ